MQFMNAVTHFLSLKHLSFVIENNLLGDHFTFLHSLENLRVLKLRAPIHILSDGFVNLVRHLPNVEQISLQTIFSAKGKLPKKTRPHLCGFLKFTGQHLI